MKTLHLLPTIACILHFGFQSVAQEQVKPKQDYSILDTSMPAVITTNSKTTDALAYDEGTIRFLASSDDTKGSFSVFELKENPGSKTPWLRHNNWDESFYVIEGVLTVKINEKIDSYPAGSYIFIPRAMPHGLANLGTVPAKILVTFTPSAYDQFFKERVELFKTIKPDNPQFAEKFSELRKKNSKFGEILGTWDMKKN